jgi:hypothetical protein
MKWTSFRKLQQAGVTAGRQDSTMHPKWPALVLVSTAWLTQTGLPAQADGQPDLAGPRFGQLDVIELPGFLNKVASFGENGEPAVIVKAWDDAELAGGRWVYFVSIRSASGLVTGVRNESDVSHAISNKQNAVTIVHRDSGRTVHDTTITDNPQHDEKAISLVRGVIDGRRGTFLLVALRSTISATPAPVHILLYRLVKTAMIDSENYYFEEQSHWDSTVSFCGASEVLKYELHSSAKPATTRECRQ